VYIYKWNKIKCIWIKKNKNYTLFFFSKIKNKVKRKNKLNNQEKKQFFNVQKKGTPFKNPSRSGASPIGVRAPPMLLTIKQKNII
jgi:16S rRNA G527 N7-methylase RsmG